jgi:hypothetical protein
MDRRLFIKGASAGAALPIQHHELFAQADAETVTVENDAATDRR